MTGETFSRILDEFTHQLIALAPKVGLGILLFMAFWIAGIAAKLIILQIGRRTAENVQEVLLLLARTAKGGLIIFGLVTALGTMGIGYALHGGEYWWGPFAGGICGTSADCIVRPGRTGVRLPVGQQA